MQVFFSQICKVVPGEWLASWELSPSHVDAEYFKHVAKLRRGTYLCVRCRAENTVVVFESMSQVVVSLAGRPALWGLLNLRWYWGQWQPELGRIVCFCHVKRGKRI